MKITRKTSKIIAIVCWAFALGYGLFARHLVLLFPQIQDRNAADAVGYCILSCAFFALFCVAFGLVAWFRPSIWRDYRPDDDDSR